MLFLSLKHIFDTFVGYSNIQIVETLTISPPHKKICDKSHVLHGSYCVLRIKNYLRFDIEYAIIYINTNEEIKETTAWEKQTR